MNMEDRVYEESQRIVKRRLMEGQVGLEVRRLHILYFLSRDGRSDHPHLIRIHHLSKYGVRLKDIKRWLGELRGKDMPESFAWSYKRRYKTRYVWQDLMDDDLVTPISDNEYVLKGSEISHTTNNLDFPMIPMQQEQPLQEEIAKEGQEFSSKANGNKITSSEIEESSPSFGSEASSTLTLTNGSGKQDSEKNSEVNSWTSPSRPLLTKEKKRKTKKIDINGDSISTSTDKPFRKSRGIFRNLLTCGAVETNESAVVMSLVTSKRSRRLTSTCSSHPSVDVKNSANEIKGEYRDQSAAYKPLYGPNCSQCGKRFRPEKLYTHMKSCRGIKAMAKGPNTALSVAENTSTASRNEISSYFITR